ncbi:L,D-transpeptidase family protein [Streptomyces sp. NPDC091266]|uniref:L,D-transpeptidase family protein n=1 Tax=Streptomyces sp. NPDC091266 TaxID=3365978 RepID=UPI00380C9FC8
MGFMRRAGSAMRTAAVAAAGLVLLAGCGGGASGDGAGGGAAAKKDGKGADGPARGPAPTTHLKAVPGVGAGLRSRIPAASRQVVAVYGKGVNSADATVVLYDKGAKGWDRKGSWAAHNGRRGWTADHREGDKRSPVGVFTLTDAGGVLADPGAKLPYTHSAAFTPPSYWAKSTRHDFDYVVAINYNRAKGTSPLDPARPDGQAKGGGIWLHMDHGSGTSGCVSISRSGMAAVLRALDPARHPVVVMGDKAHLSA